ncbi:hypothetical protein CFAEC_03105 [Corynebacterium faecale]|uniref:hypothetical protein n=1 Tax=Corynebacterium faecale TaxID=1758466 RepID=UPI0025B504B6|nr:hypothetical protein [Corynebacterium faecale]WJY91476.1 hypothetical protein CFAEC_03105 [Corynebacterium faecale]
MPGKAMSRKVNSGEQVYVDLTSPLSTMLFPVLELIVITGVCWMGIGYMDRLPDMFGYTPATDFPPGTRELILGIWAALSAWRFGLPLWRQRRFRITVTDRKLLVRPSGLRSRYDSIPITYMRGVQRRRNTLILGVGGQSRPYVINNVPKVRKVESVLKDLQHW